MGLCPYGLGTALPSAREGKYVRRACTQLRSLLASGLLLG